MAKYYYNGVLLPEIPADVLAEYPYCYILRDSTGGIYKLVFNTSVSYYFSGQLQSTEEKPFYMVPIATADTTETWEHYKTSSAKPYVNSSNLIWSNYDIPKNSATATTIYFKGSDPIHDHNYTEVVTTAATCTTDGVKSLVCECGDAYTEAIPMTGHTFVNGVCTVCGIKSIPLDINGVGLPDIPTDVLASYPYATVFRIKTVGADTEHYLLVTSNTSFGHCNPGVITGVNYEVVGSFGAGVAYMASPGATKWTYGADRVAGENLVAIGTATTDSGVTIGSLAWANHNIFEITSVDTDTGEHTNGDIWFAKSINGSDDESLVATHCYYNGVFLPVIPSEVLEKYPYCWIRNNTQTGYYDLFLSSSPWWMTDATTVSTANYTEGIQWYRISIHNPGDEWTFNQSWTENGDFTADLNRPFLWSNHNIPTGSVTGSEIYYTGSSPVPVVESYKISRNRLSGLANQVRRLCGTTETLTPERMETRMTGLNIELQEAHVISSDQVQTILPDKGYYGFSSIIVEALDISGGTGGDGGTGDEDTGETTGLKNAENYPFGRSYWTDYETDNWFVANCTFKDGSSGLAVYFDSSPLVVIWNRSNQNYDVGSTGLTNVVWTTRVGLNGDGWTNQEYCHFTSISDIVYANHDVYYGVWNGSYNAGSTVAFAKNADASIFSTCPSIRFRFDEQYLIQGTTLQYLVEAAQKAFGDNDGMYIGDVRAKLAGLAYDAE